MKIAIVGSNSFLANEIVNSTRFANHHFVLYGINNQRPSSDFIFFKYPEAPLDIESLLQADVIIYCAGAGIQSNLNEDVELIYELNSFLPIRMFNYLNSKNYTGKVITFGSYFEIGESKDSTPINENGILESQQRVPNEYCISKRVFSRFNSSKSFTFKNYQLFLPTIYSKNENPFRLIPYVVERVKNNQEMEFTEGSQIRQYLHTDDLVRFLGILIDNNTLESGFYNMAPDEFYSVKEVVKLIFQELNKPFIESYFGRKSGRDESMKILCMDNSKMKSTGFKPEVDLVSGIRKYL